jgi:hypothetical protein
VVWSFGSGNGLLPDQAFQYVPHLISLATEGGYGFIDDIWNQVMHDVIGYNTTVKHDAWVWIEWDTPSRRMLEKKDKDESGI